MPNVITPTDRRDYNSESLNIGVRLHIPKEKIGTVNGPHVLLLSTSLWLCCNSHMSNESHLYFVLVLCYF